VIYDWQTIIAGAAAVIGGLTAYVAGVIQARATRKAADAQIAADRKRDLQQAKCLAAAVIPALLQFRLQIDRATDFISSQIPKEKRPDNITDNVVSIILRAQIDVPPLLYQHLINFYLLGDEAGRAAAHAVSLTFQYNDQVMRLPDFVRQHEDVNPWELLPKLDGHLGVIKRDVANCYSIAEGPHRLITDELVPQGPRYTLDLIGLW
jgi:hypothetical protein